MGVDPDSDLVLCSVFLEPASKIRASGEREGGGAVDLADFQTFPLPKATFLKVLCKRAGPQLCYTAKNVQDGKLSRVTSLLGLEPRGESRPGLVDDAESGLKKSVSFRDSLQLLSQTGPGGRHALTGEQPTPSGQRQCNLSWYSSARIPAHGAATR